jgi:hypothetical protein
MDGDVGLAWGAIRGNCGFQRHLQGLIETAEKDLEAGVDSQKQRAGAKAHVDLLHLRHD